MLLNSAAARITWIPYAHVSFPSGHVSLDRRIIIHFWMVSLSESVSSYVRVSQAVSS